MKLLEILFRLIFEFIVDLFLSIVGHYRSDASFARKELAYKPIRDFLNNTFKLNLKPKLPKRDPKDKKTLTYKIVTLALAILVILWIRHSIIEPYKIPSGSMIPTLKINDHIFVNKLAYGLRLPFIGEVMSWKNPKRGEVFIFVPPSNRDVVYVKRVIGLPGDTIRVEDNKLYINDQYIDRVPTSFYPAMEDVGEKFDGVNNYEEDNHELFTEDLMGTKHYVLFYKDRDYAPSHKSIEITVPKDSYFAMGDNRDHSSDSRVWGFVDRNDVRGRALFVWFSYNSFKMFTSSWIRFSRIGTMIR